MAGGYAIPTKFGTFYGSNLTPDPEHGIGDWEYRDFERALTRGRADGHALWPAFPYTSYAGLADQDIADLWAWLATYEPVAQPNKTHELAPGYSRFLLGFWRMLAFDRTPYQPRDLDDALVRGGYLVEVVGHCGECHTPRSGIGKVQRKRALQGQSEPPEPAPDITPGHLDWTVKDWLTFFEMGMLPNGDWVGGEMLRVVDEGTSKLSAADREAMARWMTEQVPPSEKERE